MKLLFCGLLFLLVSFSSAASREWDFINRIERLSSEELHRQEKEYLRKKHVPFSEEEIQLKIIQANIYNRESKTVPYIEVLIWITNNPEIKNEEYLTWGHYHLSTILTFYEITDPAIEQSNLCIQFARKTGNNNFLNLAYTNLGMLYYKEKKYEQSIPYLKHAKDISFERANIVKASEYNNLGLCYQNLKQYQKAIVNFKKGLPFSKDSLSSNNIGFYYLILGNLGNTYVLSGNPDKGIPLLRQELAYYNENHIESADKASCLIDIMRYYELKKQNQHLPLLINNALDIINQLGTTEEKVRSIEKLIRFITEKHITTNELKLNKVYNSMLIESNKEIKEIRSSISQLLYEEKISALVDRSELEKHNYIIQQKNNRLVLYSSLIVAGILILLLINVIRTNKQRLIRSQQVLTIQQQQEEIVKNEQIILQQQFQNQKLELNSLLTNLSIKQQTETGFLEKIKELKRKKNISPEQIIQELQLSINNLIEIDRKFINESVSHFELKPEFSARILEKHPELTELDIRYCNYFITGLSSKEIGLLHNLSDVSVRVLKNKIKNKLGLHKDDSMIDYLKQFVF